MKHLLKTSTLLLLALLAGTEAWGLVRYAAPAGTDADGLAPTSPGSLTAMIARLQAGDTLYLLDGQYDLTQRLTINSSGTAQQPITIAAADGAKPVLDFRRQPNGTNGVQVGGSYLYIRGLTIRYAGKKGLWLEKAAYCTLECLDVYGCCDSGIQLRSGGHNTVVNCDSHDNFDYQADGGNADGFADKQGTACAGNAYIGCRSWNNSDDGWDSFQRVTDGTPTVYICCIAYNNGQAAFDLTNHPRANGVDKDLDCFKNKDMANVANGGNPNGFKLGGQSADNKASGNYTRHNAELYRCLAIGHRSKGFDQNNNAGRMTIINCTAYQNNINYGFGNDYPYTLDIRNCVSLAPTGGTAARYHLATSAKGTITEHNNTWDAGFSASEDDFLLTDPQLILADRQADGALPETLLLHLKPSATNLIDKGQPYNSFEGEKIADYVSYTGVAPDLGCYEYGGQTTAVTPTVPQTIPADGALPTASAMPRYDVNGRRVGNDYHGLVVQCGQKMMQ